MYHLQWIYIMENITVTYIKSINLKTKIMTKITVNNTVTPEPKRNWEKGDCFLHPDKDIVGILKEIEGKYMIVWIKEGVAYSISRSTILELQKELENRVTYVPQVEINYSL